MEAGRAATRPGRLTPWALSTRPRGPLVLSSRRGGSGTAWALLSCPLLRRPPSHLHSEFDLFRGLLLCVSYRTGLGCPDSGGRGGATRPKPGGVAPDPAPHHRGRSLCADCTRGPLCGPVRLPAYGASACPAVPRSDHRRSACPAPHQPDDPTLGDAE